MPQWPRQDHASMCEFYGNPDANGDGTPDRTWEDNNLVLITPPYPMVISWDTSVALKRLKVHKRCSESLLRILDAIGRHYGSAEAIRQARMHICGGVYNFRLKRGGHTLSNHSWGSAIDLDPQHNAFGQRWVEGPRAGMMPRAVIELFQAEGWTWGGLWPTADAMHFQAANL